MNKLYEQIFQEASKRRFIEPIWQQLSNNAAGIMKMTQYQDEALPNSESVIKWVDSGAADKYGIDWQKLKSDVHGTDEAVRIINSFYDYYSKGGSIKDKKALAQDDVKQVFRGHSVTFCEKGDCSGYDMALLGENDRFIFVAPLTHKGAEWMDSFECGGEGARWCIGTSDNRAYWDEYLSDSTWFILAFNKAAYNTPVKNRKDDTLKYMIQLTPFTENTQAWKQSDDPDETIPISEFEHFFGMTAVELGEAFALHIACDDTDYSGKASDDMYDFESNEFTNPWPDAALAPKKLYLSNFYLGKYYKSDVEQQIRLWDAITIDCEGLEFHPERFTGIANSLVKNPGNIYDADDNYKMLDLTGFIRSFNGGDYIHLTFINGKFDCVYITGNVEVNVYFEGCEINKLYYYKHQRDNSSLNFVEGTEIEDMFWGSEAEPFWCNMDNLKIEKDPYYEYYLPEEDDIDD